MSAREFGEECITRSHLLTSKGRPIIFFGRNRSSTSRTAARVVYRLFVGELRPEQVVSHRCRNKKCLNPRHLYLRGMPESVADNPNRVLTAEDYYYIRRSPLSLGQLGEKFGYSLGGLGRIRRAERGYIERFSLRYALLLIWERATRQGRRDHTREKSRS
jgi:hypothetical protein